MAKAARKSRATAPDGFWDRPALMDMVADLMFVFAIAGLAWAAVAAVQRLPILPLREVVVDCPVQHVRRAQLEQVARSALTGNLLTVNLETGRAAFEKLPWVRRASLRRQWPDRLALTIEEHVAVARWQQGDKPGQLVNDRGEVFTAEGAPVLPLFVGPEGQSILMLERYRQFERELAAIDRKPEVLMLSAREAWQVRLDDGVLLNLGRDQPKHPLAERLTRFTTHYRDAARRSNLAVAAVDMRYPNGFVLRARRPEKG